MKIELSQTPLESPQEIGTVASELDALHNRVLKIIERLQKDLDGRAAAIANRWKTALIGNAEKHALMQQEILVAFHEIRKNAQTELDGVLKQAGALHARLDEQKRYYDSPAKVLSRAALGSSERTAYLHQLAFAGPGEIGHMAQFAVGAKNTALAAAILSVLDSRPAKDRPLSGVALAEAMQLPEYVKVREYLKIGDARLQGIVLAVRTWTLGRANPISTLSLALRNREIDKSFLDDGDE